MQVGVNYTPSTGWFHSWLDPDPDAIRRDLEAIAGLGLDHIRIFPLWPLLQPNRTLIRERPSTTSSRSAGSPTSSIFR